jgi:hypothetical protein
VVVLPALFGLRSPNTSPRYTSRSRPRTPSRLPQVELTQAGKRHPSGSPLQRCLLVCDGVFVVYLRLRCRSLLQRPAGLCGNARMRLWGGYR